MQLPLTPLLFGVGAARNAVADAIDPDDQVMIDDRTDHWVFEFVPSADVLGGGVSVSVAKDDFRILGIIRWQ